MTRCAYTLAASRRQCPNTATRGRWCDTHHRLMTMHAKPERCDVCPDGFIEDWDTGRLDPCPACNGTTTKPTADHTEDT